MKRATSSIGLVAFALSGCVDSAVAPNANGSTVARQNLVPVAMIINELKCDYREGMEQKSQRVRYGSAAVALTLSTTTDQTQEQSLKLSIPVFSGFLSLKPSLSKSKEHKTVNTVTLKFTLDPDLRKHTTDPDALQCDPQHRLPSPIIPAADLKAAVDRAPAGSPYLVFFDDAEISGQFYLKKSSSVGLSVETIPVSINPGTLGSSAEYIQSYDICINLGENDKPTCAVKGK